MLGTRGRARAGSSCSSVDSSRSASAHSSGGPCASSTATPGGSASKKPGFARERPITSRTHRREDLKRNDCVEVDPPKKPRGFKNERYAKKHNLPLMER